MGKFFILSMLINKPLLTMLKAFELTCLINTGMKLPSSGSAVISFPCLKPPLNPNNRLLPPQWGFFI